MIDIFDAGV